MGQTHGMQWRCRAKHSYLPHPPHQPSPSQFHPGKHHPRMHNSPSTAPEASVHLPNHHSHPRPILKDRVSSLQVPPPSLQDRFPSLHKTRLSLQNAHHSLSSSPISLFSPSLSLSTRPLSLQKPRFSFSDPRPSLQIRPFSLFSPHPSLSKARLSLQNPCFQKSGWDNLSLHLTPLRLPLPHAQKVTFPTPNKMVRAFTRKSDSKTS